MFPKMFPQINVSQMETLLWCRCMFRSCRFDKGNLAT